MSPGTRVTATLGSTPPIKVEGDAVSHIGGMVEMTTQLGFNVILPEDEVHEAPAQPAQEG